MSYKTINQTTVNSFLIATSGLSSEQTTLAAEQSDIQQNATTSALVEFSQQYFWIHGYICVCVCLFGLLANSANIVVLTRKHMVTSTNYILLWLAVSDLLKMVSYMPFAIHFYILYPPEFVPGRFQTKSIGWIRFLMFQASFGIVCHSIAIWLTIALAIFRFIYICMPTKGSIYCNLQRAKIVIMLIYLLTIILLIPNYIINSYGENHDILPNETVYEARYREGSDGYDVLIQINYYIQAILIKLTPCVMLTILTILLISAMHRAYQKRMKLKSQGRKDESDRHREHNRTTGMLLAIVVFFLITEVPQGILTMLVIIDKSILDIYNNLGDLFDFVALFNNSINFVLYCTMSKQFRDTFVDIFCQCCPQERPGWMKLRLVTTPNGTSCSGNKDARNSTKV